MNGVEKLDAPEVAVLRQGQRSSVTARLSVVNQEICSCCTKTFLSLLWSRSYVPFLRLVPRN